VRRIRSWLWLAWHGRILGHQVTHLGKGRVAYCENCDDVHVIWL